MHCLREEWPAKTRWRRMKVCWWCRSWRTDSRSTRINWSMCVWPPWTWETLCQGFASLSSSCCVFVDEQCLMWWCLILRIMTICSSASLNTWSGSHSWAIARRPCRWTPPSSCRSVQRSPFEKYLTEHSHNYRKCADVLGTLQKIFVLFSKYKYLNILKSSYI